MCLQQKAVWGRQHIRNFGWNILKEEQVTSTGINRSSDIKTGTGMHTERRGWEKRNLERPNVRQFNLSAL